MTLSTGWSFSAAQSPIGSGGSSALSYMWKNSLGGSFGGCGRWNETLRKNGRVGSRRFRNSIERVTVQELTCRCSGRVLGLAIQLLESSPWTFSSHGPPG